MPAASRILRLSLLGVLAWVTPVGAGEVRVGVASNFLPTFERLAVGFELSSGHEVVTLGGSTGKLYAQIRAGLELDLFLAADAERPRRLEAEEVAVAGSRTTYAVGRLVLWAPDLQAIDASSLAEEAERGRLAIANPRLAPYGRAARQVLTSLNLWERLERRLVLGENIAQTFQFVASGNARLGLVAHAQVRRAPWRDRGAAWVVPVHMHDPIEQQAVRLSQNRAGRELLAYLLGAQARGLLEEDGYELP